MQPTTASRSAAVPLSASLREAEVVSAAGPKRRHLCRLRRLTTKARHSRAPAVAPQSPKTHGIGLERACQHLTTVGTTASFDARGPPANAPPTSWCSACSG